MYTGEPRVGGLQVPHREQSVRRGEWAGEQDRRCAHRAWGRQYKPFATGVTIQDEA
jgi:hypothetical protein